MIIFYHNGIDVVELFCDGKREAVPNSAIVQNLLQLSKKHDNKVLIWCHIHLKENLNISEISNLLHHKKLMLSYNPFQNGYLDKSIGYVEESPFLKITKNVTYPTWQMSSWVGVMNTAVINSCSSQSHAKDSFDYFLNSFAKLAMPSGLFCYSEPKLLKGKIMDCAAGISSKTALFIFIKQHFKTRWIFLLLINLLVYEKKLPLFAFLQSLFYRRRNLKKIDLDKLLIQSSKEIVKEATIDVIIPTIGRKKYLFDVLKDLALQTKLPINVIIVEQNPIEGSQTELDFLTNQQWPFKIKHTFTHHAGACNARNICLSLVESDFVFFADDDIRFETNLFQQTLDDFNKYGCEIIQMACLNRNDKLIKGNIFQSPFFGAGCSFVKKTCIKDIEFNMSFEFGFGEDNDFGSQLRNKGFDIIYVSNLSIKHLKAPMGGFRSKPVLKWSYENIQPKPSPTVMLYKILHQTNEQLLGYKIILFFKYYRSQSIKNPIKYYRQFKLKWNKSIFWANELNK